MLVYSLYLHPYAKFARLQYDLKKIKESFFGIKSRM